MEVMEKNNFNLRLNREEFAKFQEVKKAIDGLVKIYDNNGTEKSSLEFSPSSG